MPGCLGFGEKEEESQASPEGGGMNFDYDAKMKEIAEQGTIVPVPLIRLAAAIGFPFVIVGCLIERTARWIMNWGGEK